MANTKTKTSKVSKTFKSSKPAVKPVKKTTTKKVVAKSNTVKTTNTNFSNYWPSNNAEFYKWFNNFYKTFNANYKSFGFTPAQYKSFKTAYNAWNRYFKAWQKAYNAEQRAFTKANSYRSAAEKAMNGFWYRLSTSNHNWGQFSNFGVSAKVSKPSATKTTTAKKATTKKAAVKKSTTKVASKSSVKSAPKSTVKSSVKKATSVKKVAAKKPMIKKSTATTYKAFPYVRTDWNAAGKVSVYVWANSNSAGKFPTWAKGVALQYRKKGGKWQNLTTTNTWPFVHVVGTTKGASYEYRAAYAYGNGKFAPWSKTNTAVNKAA